MQCPTFLKHILTEPNNKTFCPIRMVAIVGALVFFGLSIANYAQHAVFDPQNYAIGLGALVGGTGVALGLKKDSKSNDSPSDAPSTSG